MPSLPGLSFPSCTQLWALQEAPETVDVAAQFILHISYGLTPKTNPSVSCCFWRWLWWQVGVLSRDEGHGFPQDVADVLGHP